MTKNQIAVMKEVAAAEKKNGRGYRIPDDAPNAKGLTRTLSSLRTKQCVLRYDAAWWRLTEHGQKYLERYCLTDAGRAAGA